MTVSPPDILAEVAEKVRADYVFPESAERCAVALREAFQDRDLNDVGPADLCAEVTQVMQDATSDLHLRLVYHPNGAPDEQSEERYASHWSRQAEVTAGGIESVRRTPDNVAVVSVAPFLGLPVYAGQWQVAAMAMCRGASAVVLDLRECRGGTPDSVALVCSYFFDPEPVHLTDVVERSGRRQHWTLPFVPGERLGRDLPVAVVVSGRTFSGGEELAYNLQQLGRAVVVGERTRGGAHPRIGVKVHDNIELALPVARPENPRSGASWEGVGVEPDIQCEADDALELALIHLAGQ